MTPHSEEPKFDRWLIYVIGCLVFVGILYFTLRHFLEVSIAISLGCAVPIGVIGFLVVAKVLEETDTPPGFWDDLGG